MTLYLNHAGTSWPKPPAVRQAFVAALDAPPERWAIDFTQAHDAVAAAFGVATDTLLPTPGATSALAVAVADVLSWSPSDRVLTSGMEHQALMRPLERLEAQGVEVVEIPRGDGPLDLDALEAALRERPVRLVAMSVAANVTGEILPYREIVAMAHEHGAVCLLDGAQAAGWLRLDLTELGVDLFAFAGHKGPQAPYGVGGLYVRPGLRPAGYCDTGSVDRPALVALATGLATMADAEPLDRIRDVTEAFRAAATGLPGVRAVGAGPRLPICSLVVEGRQPSELARALAERGVVVNGSTHCAPRAHRTLGTAGTLRFSFGPTSSHDDAARAVQALRSVC
ncbi:MAG: aminotransferase class V-fold PLP-dependent enzyme [Myxococcota bacterium]